MHNEKMKVTGHCIVKNEDRWIWFALQSVLPYVEKIFVYDTGSTDNTVEVIKSIKSNKILLEEKGNVNPETLVKLRQEQIERTTTDWFLIIDGDEIWPSSQIKLLLDNAEKSSKDTLALINKTRNCLGDIYHYQPENSGNYQIGQHKGNLNIRLIRKTNQLTVKGMYPLEAYSDQNGSINAQPDKLVFCNCWYLHTTYLQRSSQDKTKTSGSLGKAKYPEIGKMMSKTELPEALFLNRPDFVEDPFVNRSVQYELKAHMIHPLIRLKKSIS